MLLPSGTYLIRANPAAATLSFQDLSAHLARATRGLRPPNLAAPNLEAPNLEAPGQPAPGQPAPGQTAPGQALARKPVASNQESPTLEGP